MSYKRDIELSENWSISIQCGMKKANRAKEAELISDSIIQLLQL